MRKQKAARKRGNACRVSVFSVWCCKRKRNLDCFYNPPPRGPPDLTIVCHIRRGQRTEKTSDWFPASHCSTDSRWQQSEPGRNREKGKNKKKKRLAWLKGNGGDLRRSCSLRTGTILDPNWKVKRTFGFESLRSCMAHILLLQTQLVSLVQDDTYCKVDI